ncbi:exodeoxyribonuclease VII small subunit [Albibacterium indicum]|uniref:exodeoxyribonuclease VII small subunit n=1 Tax=Albibacterium indicum TaxID=2292082 RepID=UPI000E5327DD|nr:exodeoxyribonuclease VII small subunit [Pedobacter indicus]
MADKITYTEAFDELQSIISHLERGDIPVDELAAKVKRASLLIEVCRTKLTATEEEVKRVIDQLPE